MRANNTPQIMLLLHMQIRRYFNKICDKKTLIERGLFVLFQNKNDVISAHADFRVNSRLWTCLTSKHFNRKQNASSRRYINKIFTTLYISIIFLLFPLLLINVMANCLFSNRESIIKFYKCEYAFLRLYSEEKIHSQSR